MATVSSASISFSGTSSFTLTCSFPYSGYYFYWDIADYDGSWHMANSSYGGWTTSKNWGCSQSSVSYHGYQYKELDTIQARVRVCSTPDGSDWTGDWAYTSVYSNPAYVPPLPSPPLAPTNVNITNITTTSARVNFTKGTRAYYTKLYKRFGDYATLSTTGTYFDLSGLSAGTTYYFDLYSQDSYGQTSSTLSNRNFTTSSLPLAPAPTGAQVYWSGSDLIAFANANSSIGTLSYDKRIYNTGTGYDTTFRGDDYWGAGNASHHVVTTSSLNGGDTVEFRVRYYPVTSSYTLSNAWSYCGSYTRPSRPATFAWTHPPIAGQPVSLTAVEWNAFTSNIALVINYKFLTARTFTTVKSGDAISSIVFNQAQSAISYVSSTTVPSVNPGDAMRAEYFNTLISDLNKVT